MARLALPAGAAVVFVAVLWAWPRVAASTGPCDPAEDALTPERAELAALVNSWRAAELGQPPAELSRPANLGAQWFAEEALHGSTSGHIDRFQRGWAERLADCGYDPYWAQGSGEAIAVFFADEPRGPSPADALAQMTEGGGQHSNVVQAPVGWRCIGVGHAANPAATGAMRSHVWVVVMAQHGGPCPEPEEPLTPSPTPTMPAPTPSPSPSPAPVLHKRAVVSALARGD